MQQKQFKIGQLASKLNIAPFVIRFWEKEFNIKPNRTEGQQRFYSEKDLEKFTRIKELLYEQGMTIAGAKKQLCADTNKILIISATKIGCIENKHIVAEQQRKQLIGLKHQLLKIRELLE